MFWEKLNGKLIDTVMSFLDRENALESNKKAAVRYSLTYVFNELEKMLLLMVFFATAGKLMEFMVAVISLVCLRIYMGGFHRKTNLGCFIQSLLTFSCIVWVSDIIEFDNVRTCMVVICGIVSIWTSAPVISEKRGKYSESSKRKFKARALTVILIEIMVGSILPEINSIVITTLLFQSAETMAAHTYTARKKSV